MGHLSALKVMFATHASPSMDLSTALALYHILNLAPQNEGFLQLEI